MGKLILHIGMHKTGTSSIQESLRRFENDDVRYLRFGPPNHSIAALTVFGDAPEKLRFNAARGRDRAALARARLNLAKTLKQELASPQPTLILSGEGFGLLPPAGVERLRRVLESHVERVEILAYLRPPLGFMASNFQQMVFQGRSVFRMVPPGYRRRFEKYVETFGRERIAFRLFDRAHLRDGDVVADFLAQIGHPDLPVTHATVNETRSLEAVAVLYHFNRHHAEGRPKPLLEAVRRRLDRLLAGAPATRMRFAPEAVLTPEVEEDRAWMAETAGFALDDPAPPEGAVTIRAEADLLAWAVPQAPRLAAAMAAEGVALEPGADLDRALALLLETTQPLPPPEAGAPAVPAPAAAEPAAPPVASRATPAAGPRTLFVHVGHGKTGSSFVQSLLAGHGPALAAAGLHYPEISREHTAMAAQGQVTSGNGHLLSEDACLEHPGLTAGSPVFSREHLMGEIAHNKDRLLARLEAVAARAGCTRISFLALIRDPVEHAASSFQQAVKRSGYAEDLDAYLATYATPETVARFLERVGGLSTPHDVCIRNYSRHRRRLAEEVAAWLGLAPGTLDASRLGRVNRSLTDGEIALQRRLNAVLGPSSDLFADLICESLPDHGGPSPVPSVTAQERLLARLATDMDRVDAAADPGERYGRAVLSPPESGDGAHRLDEAQIEVIGTRLAGELDYLRAVVLLQRAETRLLEAERALSRGNPENAVRLLAKAEESLEGAGRKRALAARERLGAWHAGLRTRSGGLRTHPDLVIPASGAAPDAPQ